MKIDVTICHRCKQKNDKLFASFGNFICQNCKDNRPRRGLGNSGMSFASNFEMIFDDSLHLVCVPKSDGNFGNLFFSHYPKSKGIVGRTLCYNIFYKKRLIGIIGGASPPKNYTIFKKYFECDERFFINNNVFRIIESEKNLGTKILKLFRARIREDYFNKYKDKLLGIVTFVEKPRTGSLYKADNWNYLGETQGKRMRRNSDTWEKEFKDGEIKHIFGYKYKK